MTQSKPESSAFSLPMEELIRACIDTSDTPAWEEFVRRTHSVIAATIFRTARRYNKATPELVADLVQDTYLRICTNRCRVLREFHAERPEAIFGLMKTVAFSVVCDYFRNQQAEIHGSGRDHVSMDEIAARAVSGSDGPDAFEAKILVREIDAFLASNPKERRIFWLYYRHGFTSRAIAAIPHIGLTQKGVESTIHRLITRVREWLSGRKDSKAKGNASGSPL
jgi:RNA polymerase sigma factor (sigma-70 family)